MQLTCLRLGYTKNLGNYESAKLEAEAIPSDGQSVTDLYEELDAYIVNQLANASTTPKTNGNGKSPAAEKPKAKSTTKPKTEKPKAKPKTEKPKAKPNAEKSAVAFEKAYEAETFDDFTTHMCAWLPEATTDADEIYARVVSSDTLEEFADNLSEFALYNTTQDLEHLKQCCKIATKYYRLKWSAQEKNGHKKLVDRITKVFTTTNNYIVGLEGPGVDE